MINTVVNTDQKSYQVKYFLSEKGQKAAILAGQPGQRDQSAYGKITPEALEICAVNADGSVVLNLQKNEYGILPEIIQIVGDEFSYDYPRIGTKYYALAPEFDRPMTAEELVLWEATRRVSAKAKRAELEPEFISIKKAWEANAARKKAEKTAKKAAEEKIRADREAIEHAEKEAREAEKLAWITTNGSDYLKDAVALGYNCQRQYITERATLEFPDFQVDFDGHAEWRVRACPSREALAEVKALVVAGHNAKVVWLTNGTAEPEEPDYNYEGFEPCEAVVIRDYLGKYDLIKF